MFLDLFIRKVALHVSGGSSARRQEHTTVQTASGIVNCKDRAACVTVISIDNTWSCMYSYVLLMMSGGTAWNTWSVCKIK